LANLERLSIGDLHGPEDVVWYEGKIYVSSQSGTILEIDPEADTHRVYAQTGGSALGMEMDAAGNLIIADAYRGLLSVAPDGSVTVLTVEVDGTPILYADDLDIAANGVIYFSDATSIIREGYVFSNGVAMSESGDILVNETGTYQVHRVSPNGDSRVIMENLPGFPDNINRGPKMADGTETFLLGLVSQRSKWLDDNSNNVVVRKIAMRLPEFLRPKSVSYGLIIQIDVEGTVLKTWQDPSGDYPEATGAIIAEDGYMYVSSLTAPDLGRMKINK